MQIYDAQIPERVCLALPDNASPVELVHSRLSEEQELGDGLPGGLSSYTISAKLHHKDLWPPNAWDLLGWLIGSLTLFIAAGVQLFWTSLYVTFASASSLFNTSGFVVCADVGTAGLDAVFCTCCKSVANLCVLTLVSKSTACRTVS
jgi:hypothetical protein